MIKKKKKTLIIAEAGVNHNGEIKIAKKLIDLASQTGADYIKFQTFKTENLVTKNAMKAKYQIRNSNKSDRSQFKMLKKLELSRKDHIQLIDYCKKRKIKFLSSVFDIESFDLLNALNQKIIKIPSSEINNIPLLRYISKFKKKLIVSTGMSSLLDIKKNIKILTKNIINIKDISILHCISSYPTLDSDVNLKVMSTLKKAFKCRIGYSDHTKGIEIPIAAVAASPVLHACAGPGQRVDAGRAVTESRNFDAPPLPVSGCRRGPIPGRRWHHDCSLLPPVQDQASCCALHFHCATS